MFPEEKLVRELSLPWGMYQMGRLHNLAGPLSSSSSSQVFFRHLAAVSPDTAISRLGRPGRIEMVVARRVLVGRLKRAEEADGEAGGPEKEGHPANDCSDVVGGL